MELSVNQLEEQVVCSRFLEQLGNKSLYIDSQPDPPDIVLCSENNKKKISLELTKTVQEKPQNEDYSLIEKMGFQRQFVNHGARLFYKEYGYKILCNFSIYDLKLKKTEFTKLLNPILELIHKEIQSRKSEVIKRFTIHNHGQFPSNISYISVFYGGQHENLEWGLSGIFDVPPILTQNIIEKAIESKTEALHGYGSSYFENWLLIYENELGSWFSEKHKFEEYKILSEFDRTYYLTIEQNLYILSNNKSS